MDMQIMENFFFWCLILNLIIYTVTAIALVYLRGFVCRIHQKMFALDEASINKLLYSYLAAYKLLLTIFVFVPWLALKIIN